MIRDREIDRILGAWAREGVDVLPDRLIDAVLADVARQPQRRHAWLGTPILADRPWLRLVAVLAALLAFALAAALFAGAPRQPEGKPFRGGDELLEPGRYVIDAPFDFHLSIDVPAGWLGVEEGSSWTALAFGAPEPRPELIFATVKALPVDPCRPELGLQYPSSGLDARAILEGLADVPGIGPEVVGSSVVGGRAARTITLVGGEGGLACANGNPFTLWSLGQPYTLVAGARHRLWIVDIDGRTLVVAARDFGPSTRAARDLDAVVGSILLGADAPVRPPEPSTSAVPDSEPPIPSIPPSGRVEAREGGYLAHFTVYAYGVERIARPVEGQHDWVMPVLGDWTRTSHGMVRQDEQRGTTSLSIWSIGKVYLDPCQWRTSSVQLMGPEDLGGYEQVAHSLSGLWNPQVDEELTAQGYTPPPFSPIAGSPVLQGYPGIWSMHFDLIVPDGFDVAACDNGEYRIWEDQDGTGRSARPGEHINVRVALLDAGVEVLEGGWQAGTSDGFRADLMEMLDSSWIGAPIIGS